MTQGQEPVGRLGATSIDCPDPGALADFYARLLGMRRIVEHPDGSVVAIGDGASVLAFLRVDHYVAPTWPDPGQAQQMHLDISVTDLDAAVTAAERLGARRADHQPQPDGWRVMFDPAGHPFCLTTFGAD
ncbi:MAG TPA: VOC family protein [Mycobacterium sp.]|nr:VOC family protein [Mycobacterium sp.]